MKQSREEKQEKHEKAESPAKEKMEEKLYRGFKRKGGRKTARSSKR